MPTPPEDPGYYDQVNYVIDAWARPCNAPWYIYIETLKPALLEAFIMFISFGFGDVARGFLRPKGLGGRRTSKRKGKWAKRIPRWPEIGNMIGRNLPFSEQLDDFRWNCGNKTLWRIDGVSQKFLFYWLVTDITIDFAFNWTSLLYETIWCQQAHKGRFSWQTDGLHLIPAGVWLRIGFTEKDYEFPFPNWVILFGNTGANGAIICAAVSFKAVLGQDPATSYQVRVVEKDTGVEFYNSGVMPALPDGKLACPLNGTVPPNTQYEVQAMHDGGWAYYHDGVVIGMEV